ncbi:hypothetical protein AAHA92_05270 [Salvia divinorum]|uniref:Uncharacterized protein n=1 Tax=Salvia divinorum TaxID=28513 RepID=A0ABD1I2U7_SALDI
MWKNTRRRKGTSRHRRTKNTRQLSIARFRLSMVDERQRKRKEMEATVVTVEDLDMCVHCRHIHRLPDAPL